MNRPRAEAGHPSKKVNARAPARTDRPYVAPIRALRPIFRDSLGIYTAATKNSPRDQKGGITPVLFCCHNMQDAHRKESSTSVDHTCTCFTTDQEKKAGQKEYHPTDTINNSANRHNKNPGHYATASTRPIPAETVIRQQHSPALRHEPPQYITSLARREREGTPRPAAITPKKKSKRQPEQENPCTVV